MMVWMLALAAAAVSEPAGMITIEVVDEPGFWDYAGEYGYLGVIVVLLGVFLWRKYYLMRKS